MRYPIKILPALSIAGLALLPGCIEDDAATDAGAESTVTSSDVARETSEAMNTAKKFAASQVDDFRDAMQRQVEAVDARIDTLSDRAATMTGDAKTEIDEAIAALRTQRDEFMAAVNDASADSADAWSDVKSGLQKAWSDLETASADAIDRFSDG